LGMKLRSVNRKVKIYSDAAELGKAYTKGVSYCQNNRKIANSQQDFSSRNRIHVGRS